MRTLLNHESMLVQLMLARNPACACPLPTYIDHVIESDDTALSGPQIVNRSFTAYFQEDLEAANLNLVDCQLCLPETAGHELFLVQDAVLEQLAFLEFMTSPVESNHLAPFVDLVARSSLTWGLSKDAASLVMQLQAMVRTAKTKDQHLEPLLKQVRLFAFDSVACFFLSTRNLLGADEPSGRCVEASASGCAQELYWDDGIALEGWVSRSIP